MFLRRLTIENVRSILHLSIDFTTPESQEIRPWTYILGENGCGKTSILRMAALVLAGTDALSETIGDIDRWIRLGEKRAKITAKIQTANNEERDVSLELVRGEGIGKMLARNEANLSSLNAAFAHTPRSYFVGGYGVNRRPPRQLQESLGRESFRSPRAGSISTLFDTDIPLRSLDGWAMDLQYRYGSRGTQTIEKVLANLLPDVEYAGISRKNRQLTFRTPDGILPLSELSDGYQNVATWCGDLMYRITETFKDYRDPFSARGLLLLDEVDLHLHPRWQRKLAELLRKRLPKFQVIATTHSPLTAQQADEGELYILRRATRKKLELFHYEAAPNLLRIEQIVTSPLFGLESGVSAKVERLRTKVQRRKRLSPEERILLENVPLPRADPETERRKVALLRSIETSLAAVLSPAALAKVPKEGPSPKETLARSLKRL